MGLTADEVQKDGGSDPRKVALAQVLHAKTTVPQRWIAQQLEMGSAVHVSQQVRRFAQTPAANKPTQVKSGEGKEEKGKGSVKGSVNNS